MFVAMAPSGCSSAPDVSACWTDPSPDAALGEVELGLGGGDFLPVAEGDAVELEAGIQGGYHFTLRARTRGMLPGEDGSTATMFAAFTEEGEEIDILACPYQAPYRAVSGSDGFLVLGDDVFLIIDEAYVPSINGRRLLFRVEVIDADGRYARDERTLIAEYTMPPDADAGIDAAVDAGDE
jgi:hypothetical protein